MYTHNSNKSNFKRLQEKVLCIVPTIKINMVKNVSQNVYVSEHNKTRYSYYICLSLRVPSVLKLYAHKRTP